ncbi:MAG: hypothetical protein LBJ02_05415 [Bifidobacteriaceae bacterium]|jgi:hypothetical protein|nr:hypothetical protein [Bifidobacteriaceae bacterium]
MKTAKHWAAFTAVAAMVAAALAPIAPDGAWAVPQNFEVTIEVQPGDGNPLFNSLRGVAAPTVTVKSGGTEWNLPMSGNDSEGYEVNEVLEDFDPDSWSYKISGVEGYLDGASTALSGPDGHYIHVAGEGLTRSNPLSYTLKKNSGGTWASGAYPGSISDAETTVVEWSNDFGRLSFTALAGDGNYVESFTADAAAVALGGDAGQQSWTDSTSASNVTLVAKFATPSEEAARIVAYPPTGLVIPGFVPSDCQTGANGYLCDEDDWGIQPLEPPAIEAADPVAAIATEVSGPFGEKILLGNSSTRGTYFTETLTAPEGPRTITKWTLEEDFHVVIDDFAWIEIGDSDDTSYTVEAVVPDDVNGVCAESGGSGSAKVGCWVPEGTSVQATATPTAGHYLTEVKVDGVTDTTWDGTGTGGGHTFSVSDGQSVEIKTAEPTEDETPVDPAGLLDSGSWIRLMCSVDNGPWLGCTPQDGGSFIPAETQIVVLKTAGTNTVYYTTQFGDIPQYAVQPTDDGWYSPEGEIPYTQISSDLLGGWAAQLVLNPGDSTPISGFYLKADEDGVVEITHVTLKRGGQAATFQVIPDTEFPTIDRRPTSTRAPDIEFTAPETWTSLWSDVHLTAQDSVGLLGVVWAKNADSYTEAQVREAAQADPAESVASGGIGTCSRPDPQGTDFYCDIARETNAADQGSFDVRFYAVDTSENITETAPDLAFYYDHVAPAIEDSFSAGDCDEGSGPYYCNEPVEVTVTVSDGFIGFGGDNKPEGLSASGSSTADSDGNLRGAVTLTYPNPDGDSHITTVPCVLDGGIQDSCSPQWDPDDEVWRVAFLGIPAEVLGEDQPISADGNLSVDAWDLYGNHAAREIDRRLQVEGWKPGVVISSATPAWNDQANSRKWYANAEDIGFDAVISDCVTGDTNNDGVCDDTRPQSGLKSYTLQIGTGAEVSRLYGPADYSGSFPWMDRISNTYTREEVDQLAAAGCPNDGECLITITATDLAGNRTVQTARVYLDRTDPAVDSISFQADDNAQADADKSTVGLVNGVGGYGHFGKEDVVIKVGVSDPGSASLQGSGAKEVRLFFQDLDSGTTEAKTVAVTNGVATYTVDADFKGVVSARVWDNLDHDSVEAFAARKLILETASRHGAEAHISSALSRTKAGNDADGLPLFASDVTVTMTVTDTYAGIGSVGCEYTTEQNPEPRACAPARDGWTKDGGDADDADAWTKATYAFTVTDDSNNIAVDWWVEDRAGYKTWAHGDTQPQPGPVDKRACLSLDKTAPKVVSVTWNNVSPDPENRTFYRSDRRATIVVEDRNFIAGRAPVKTGGTATGWQQTGAPGDWTYRVAINYTRDADYLAAAESVAVTDRAGNSLAPVLRLPDWTLDKTTPTIAISYDNNAASGGNFYGQARTATLTVQEHNFQASRIVLTDTSALADGFQGVVSGFSWELGAWRSAGDTHTASLRFASDGKFAFAATVADKAGNTGAPLARQEFYIDLTKPEIEILQVPSGDLLADGTAIVSGESVAPVVVVTDNINLGESDHSEISLELNAVDSRSRELAEPVLARVAQGSSFSFAELAALRASDGIYNLQVKATDNAGQEQTQDVTFMINRFGSVYLFDSATQDIVTAANPVQEPSDIEITEFNVNPLLEREVKVIRNGQDTSILKESDFTVTTGEEHGWNKAVYAMPASLFDEEGSYEVRLWTKDEVGNVSQNDVPRQDAEDSGKIECTAAQWATLIEDCAEGAAVDFRIDKNAPAIAVAGLEEGGEYRVKSLPVRFEVTDFFEDNIDLVDVKVGGKSLNPKQLDDSEWEVTVPNAFTPQSVVFTARDKSGRESVREIGDVLVTSNKIAIWFNNKPLFYGSVIGAAALLGGLFWLIIAWQRKNRDRSGGRAHAA